MLSMTDDPNTSVFCQFPFSWVLKAYLEELWEKVYNMKGNIRLFKHVLFLNAVEADLQTFPQQPKVVVGATIAILFPAQP